VLARAAGTNAEPKSPASKPAVVTAVTSLFLMKAGINRGLGISPEASVKAGRALLMAANYLNTTLITSVGEPPASTSA
jgi:hypothetical protein